MSTKKNIEVVLYKNGISIYMLHAFLGIQVRDKMKGKCVKFEPKDRKLVYDFLKKYKDEYELILKKGYINIKIYEHLNIEENEKL